MPLIQCPECEKEISSKAESCPHCGAPSKSVKKEKRKTHPITWIVIGLLIAGGIWFWQSPQVQDQFKPKMPIEVQYRNALLGPGMVLIVNNTSNRQLNVSVQLTNEQRGEQATYPVVLVPGGTEEIGHFEGWKLERGEKIAISHPDFRAWNGSIP